MCPVSSDRRETCTSPVLIYSHFGIYRYTTFIMYLDILYIYLENKMDYSLGQRMVIHTVDRQRKT